MKHLPLALPVLVVLAVSSCSETSPSKSAVQSAPAKPVEGKAMEAKPKEEKPVAAQPAKESAMPGQATQGQPKTLADFKVKSLEGEPVPLGKWQGKVVLVVNTASQCGYTPQYTGLEALHQQYGSQGFEVLGVPSNDFGGQEPGSAAEIRTFCTDKFHVTFPLFEKVKVTAGEGQAPLYAWLQSSTGHVPNWNFCKYLIGKDGVPIEFYSSKTTPDSADLREAIETALAVK